MRNRVAGNRRIDASNCLNAGIFICWLQYIAMTEIRLGIRLFIQKNYVFPDKTDFDLAKVCLACTSVLCSLKFIQTDENCAMVFMTVLIRKILWGRLSILMFMNRRFWEKKGRLWDMY